MKTLFIYRDKHSKIHNFRNIYGAAIDVFKREPIPQKHDFKRLKNVIITPHIAGATDQMLTDCIYLLAKRLKKIIR